VLLIVALLALYTCPHSKVEESFNLQATHDLFYHGRDASDSPYDHLQFPGVVPRTFIGAFFLSLIARFISWITPKQIFDAYVNRQSQQQSSSNGTQSLQSTSPTTTIASYYLLITASQFHIPFYSSRLLPNTFALILVTHAYAEWFRRNYRLTAMYLVFTSAIFRCDMLLLLFTVGLVLLIQRQMTIVQALSVGVTTGVLSLLLTVPLDSLLWGRLIWPEFEVWWFNTVDNRSGEYGEMVWHWYFTKALPKGMLLTALLVPLAFLRKGLIDLSLFGFFAPILGFITLYSLLPHKEIRFIFPALPMINVCAAYGMSRLHTLVFAKSQTKAKQWVCKGMYLCGVGCIALSMLGSLIFLRLSTDNYPGGVALEQLEQHGIHWENVHVHVDVAAAMTGVSLFGQRQIPFRIDKS
ncbi:dolichyl-phosphate-mannose-glycolipid alpha-mannosyltransferase, partial [Thalassiosira pseudonana CCMP1335]